MIGVLRVAYVMKNAKKISKKEVIIINLSGRGDKDVVQAAEILGLNHRKTPKKRH